MVEEGQAHDVLGDVAAAEGRQVSVISNLGFPAGFEIQILECEYPIAAGASACRSTARSGCG